MDIYMLPVVLIMSAVVISPCSKIAQLHLLVMSPESPLTWSITRACLRHRWHCHFEEYWI